MHLVFALVGDVRGSTRALRQLRWLAEAGCTVDVFSFDPPEATEALPETVRLSPIPRPSDGGPRFFWNAHRALVRAVRDRRADVCLASDLYTLPALAQAARRHGGRLAFDSRELYPHVDATAGKPWATALWTAVERRYVPRCDVVFTVNPSIARRIAETYGVPEPTVVHNLPVRLAARAAEVPAPREPVVLYQGLIRAGRGLPDLVAAMPAVLKAVPGARLDLVGDGPQRAEIERLAAPLGDRVRFHGFVPPDALVPITAAASVGVCALEPISESVRLALPNKLFEYLGAGLPVVATKLPEMRRVVEGFDVGLLVPPNDPSALAQALVRALTDEAARARWRANIPSVFAAFDPEADRRRFLRGIGVGLEEPVNREADERTR